MRKNKQEEFSEEGACKNQKIREQREGCSRQKGKERNQEMVKVQDQPATAQELARAQECSREEGHGVGQEDRVRSHGGNCHGKQWEWRSSLCFAQPGCWRIIFPSM